MVNSIVITDKSKEYKEIWSFRENGVEVEKATFSTWNKGNLGGEIVGRVLREKINRLKERGWTADSFDDETFREHYELLKMFADDVGED